MTTTETTAPAARVAPEWATHYTRLAIEALPVDITTATPPQVDEVIRTVELDQAAQGEVVARAFIAVRKAIHGEPTERREGYGWARHTVTEWPSTAEEAEAAARAADPATESKARYGYGDTIGALLATLDAARALYEEMGAAFTECDAEFVRRGGWTRYWIVANDGGHVHTTTACRTCYATTRFGWPTQLSGADGAGVVEAAGPLTCLVCFPDEREDILADRPVRFDAFETTEQRDERLRREAELAKRNAAKIAKGVTPDGKPLVVEMPTRPRHYGRTLEIKTERAAELRAVDLACSIKQAARFRVTEEEQVDLGRALGTILAALAWKRGERLETVTELVMGKADAKIKRDPFAG